MRRQLTKLASVSIIAVPLMLWGGNTTAMAQGANLPSENGSCMGFLASASNPNASGTIAVGAQAGVVSTLAQASPSGPGVDGLLSCVAQIP
jgi:hypothetical protein